MTGFPVAVIWEIMLGAALAALFLGLFVIGFVRPRRSREADQGVARMFALAERWASRGAGLGRLLVKPLTKSRRATHASARAGRKARRKTSMRRSD